MTRQWLRQLRPDPDLPAQDPAISPAVVTAAAAVLGPEPVRWALQTADAMAAEVLEQVPEHGGGPAPLATLRRSTESTVLAALRLLLTEGSGDGDHLPGEALESCREFARRGIRLDRVLRGVRLGHARLTQELTSAVEQFVPAGERLTQLRGITEELFTHADAHAGLIAESYIAERDRWRGSDEAARRATVDDLLAARPVDPEAATRRLRYDVTRTHLAAVLWCDRTEDPVPAAERLQHTATALARTLGTGPPLTLPATADTAWLWLHAPDDLTGLADRLRTGCDRAPGVRLALGPPAHGTAGMRRGHHGAREAERIARLTPGDWLTDYRDVRLVALATTDPEHARWFVHDLLGPLASDGTRVRELRETLRVYLAEEHSLRAAAGTLHVARNTITYRVKRAEELLPPSTTTGSTLELRLALEIARFLLG
ncbi:PucR family transcriptional regulator [Streptomyces platensis]|uniref:PucR family transcriptional regulator n=1 Tax=Streptomyces platensis TaxID=58346 RepID=UPI001F480AA9|nr:helix-turn-helix domain-containing protein [Streptomyces platensis]MCF3142876.1 helix-turn-helix domain-containing protein [Streptomyces platensis]